MRIRTIALALGLILAVTSAPALAAAGDMKIRFGAAYLAPTADQTVVWYGVEPEYEASMIEAQGAFSGFAGFEVMANDFLGLEATVLGTNLEVEENYIWTNDGDVLGLWVETGGDVWITPFFFSANFHFVSNDQIDLYAGPSIVYVWYGDWDYDHDVEEFDLNVDADVTFGGVVGMDVPLGSSNWMFSTAVRYFQTEAELNEASFAHELQNFKLDIDPWVIQVGVGVKF